MTCETSQNSRRQFLKDTAALAAGAWACGSGQAVAAPEATIVSTDVISRQPSIYCGWPTLTRRSSGELLLVWSGGREAHVCPFGRVDFMRSRDEGRSWSFPRTLMDSAIDDRDAGIVETAQGSLLVTTFSSLAYESVLKSAEARVQSGEGGWSPEKLARWQSARDRIPSEQRQSQLGTWMIRSTDGGVEWSARYRVPVNSPHGPVSLDDGRLLYAGKALWTDHETVGVVTSGDDGQSWSDIVTIPVRPGDKRQNYHELHAVDAGDGRLIAQIRNHNQQNHHETLQTESTDGGRTWSEPHSIGVWGYPSHLLKLRDGRLLMTYGHRRKPLGNQARLSEDAGRTWSDPVIISGDATSGDLGYPSTVELADGDLVTVWYERRPGSPNAVLRQARWKLSD